MSVIRVDNFGPSAGGTTYSARGIAKSWASFNGTGTPSIINSLNVSSLNDDGVGQYGVVYTSPFASADNFVSISGNGGSVGYSGSGTGRQFTMARSNETGKINNQHIDDGGGLTDPSKAYTGVWGDLA